MDVKKELADSLIMIRKIQQGLTKSGPLANQLNFLEKKIDTVAQKLENEPHETQSEVRLELLAHLCLFSELSMADFDSLIEAREKFQNLLPDHFEHYLSHLEGSTWAISWSGCLDCRHFSGRCNLNLSPVEDPSDVHRLEKTCSSYIRRSSKI